MKKIIFFCIFTVVFLFPSICPAQSPKQIGGFVLGSNISAYKNKVKMETALPIRYMEYLTEVEVKKMEGFKSGLLCYGNCAAPGRILRVKLKYADPSKKFYDALLKQFKKRFGEQIEWRGDPFHVLIAWKWSFIDSNNNKISMILQHNTKDEEEKLGNAIKLTITNFINQERLCFEKKHPKFRDKNRQPQKITTAPGRLDWDRFLPR
ncbi:hypothetical protein ACFL0M_15880 [Thermodesulfobacteriota bacterium]